MAYELKENCCPNRQQTCQDEQAMYQQVRYLRKVYSEKQIRLETNVSSKRQDKSTAVGTDGQINALFRAIVEKHQQNRQSIFNLINRFLSKYREGRGEDNGSENGSFAMDTYNNRLSPEKATQLDQLLWRIQEATTPKDLEDFKSMKLTEIAVELSRRWDIDCVELLDMLTCLRLAKAADLVGLIQTGSLQGQIQTGTDKEEMSAEQLLNSQLGELAVFVTVQRLENEKVAPSGITIGSLSEVLSKEELACFRMLVSMSSDPQALEMEVVDEPRVLLQEYHNYILARELEEEQRNSLLSNYQQVADRLKEYCASKSNYAQYVENEFAKYDPVQKGTMDFSTFEKALNKCRVLSPNEISVLFRGCLLLQKQILRSIVDRFEHINYTTFLDIILGRTSKRQKSIQLTDRVQLEDIQAKLDASQQLIDSLAQQKDELLYLLMVRTEEMKKAQQSQLHKALSEFTDSEATALQLRNEMAMLKLKSEGEIKRLQVVISNQNRALESYRSELQNIMGEINSRHR